MTPDPKDKVGSRRVIASISGGKDSAAMSLHLTELGIEHDRVFLDTGWEHPATYEYLRGSLTAKLGQILEIKAPLGMADLCRRKGMFPSRTIRFCTEELKVRPMQRYLRGLCFDVVNAVGIRAAESRARARLYEWEWSEAFDCETWRPLLAWSEEQVIEIHRRHDLRPNPLYLHGASRVGCWPCIFSRKSELAFLAQEDGTRVVEIRALEAELSARAGAPRAFFQANSKAQIPGKIQGGKWEWPPIPIDDVISWSRTARGGRQFELFASDARDAGCMRWGLCDVGEAKR